MKARVSHLHKTEAEWLKLATWVPEAGELVVYDPDANYKYARLKVGDGVRTLSELDFFVEAAAIAILQTHRFSEFLDAGRVSDYT